MKILDVVIAARNEAATVGAVVRAFRDAPSVNQVIVVDDASADETGKVARDAGARVISGPGIGKGEAVACGMSWVYTDRVIFCDADLKGFRAEHAEQLAQDYDGMIVGFMVPSRYVPNSRLEKATIPSLGSANYPMLSGIRSMPMSLPMSVPMFGYAMETQLEVTARLTGVPVCFTYLYGVSDVKHDRDEVPAWDSPACDKDKDRFNEWLSADFSRLLSKGRDWSDEDRAAVDEAVGPLIRNMRWANYGGRKPPERSALGW